MTCATYSKRSTELLRQTERVLARILQLDQLMQSWLRLTRLLLILRVALELVERIGAELGLLVVGRNGDRLVVLGVVLFVLASNAAHRRVGSILSTRDHVIYPSIHPSVCSERESRDRDPRYLRIGVDLHPVVAQVALHAERPYLGREVLAGLLLLGIVPNACRTDSTLQSILRSMVARLRASDRPTERTDLGQCDCCSPRTRH